MDSLKNNILKLVSVMIMISTLFISACALSTAELYLGYITEINECIKVIEEFKHDKGFFVPLIKDDAEIINDNINKRIQDLDNENDKELAEDVKRIYQFQRAWILEVGDKRNWYDKKYTDYMDSNIINEFCEKYKLKQEEPDKERDRKQYSRYINEYESIIAKRKKQRICHYRKDDIGYESWIETKSISIENGILKYTDNYKFDYNQFLYPGVYGISIMEVDIKGNVYACVYDEMYDRYGRLQIKGGRKPSRSLDSNDSFIKEDREKIKEIIEYLKSINEYNM